MRLATEDGKSSDLQRKQLRHTRATVLPREHKNKLGRLWKQDGAQNKNANTASTLIAYVGQMICYHAANLPSNEVAGLESGLTPNPRPEDEAVTHVDGAYGVYRKSKRGRERSHIPESLTETRHGDILLERRGEFQIESNDRGSEALNLQKQSQERQTVW